MDATRRMEIELPEELAGWANGQVESGRFADASEAVASALTLMREHDQDAADPEVESWLRDHVVPRYRDWRASGEPGLTVDEVRESLARRRTERQRPDAAE
jgi:putative addiction module CopG family antidote